MNTSVQLYPGPRIPLYSYTLVHGYLCIALPWLMDTSGSATLVHEYLSTTLAWSMDTSVYLYPGTWIPLYTFILVHGYLCTALPWSMDTSVQLYPSPWIPLFM